MKIFTSVCVMLGLTTVAAHAAPSYIQRDGRYGYNVTYSYTDKAKSGFYIVGRAEIGFLNFKNKYDLATTTNDVVDEFNSDKYSFESVFGGNIAFGKKIRHVWRLEGEGGYLGMFEDKDNGFEVKMSMPYIMANGYRDFSNGLYVGAGVGAAMVVKTLDNADFISGDRRDTSVSPMGAVMLGWSHKLDDNFVIDLRYRLSGLNGGDQTRTFNLYSLDTGEVVGSADFKLKTGLVLDNSISIGLRYEF